MNQKYFTEEERKLAKKRNKKKYYEKYKERIKAKSKKYYQNYKEERLIYQKEYQKNNEEKIKKYNKKYGKKYRENHREEKRNYENCKLKTDINFRLRKNIRRRINHALKGKYKPGSSIKDMGCTFKEFKMRFENLFDSKMSWDNYGKWHIDHIIPLSSFDLSNRDEFLKACHYTNLQPLWAEENLSKGDK